MEVVVIDKRILGALVVFLLGFILLYTILIRNIAQTYRASKKFEPEDYYCTRCSMEAPRKSEQEHHLDHNTDDVIIVGAGVAGSALAYTLGNDGRHVHVIERDLNEPDRIVGEVLQPGGYLKLIELGLQDCVKDIDAQRVSGYAVYKDGKHVKLPYPLEKFPSDVSGRGFHNGRFIQRMREKATTLSNVRLEQGSVTSLIVENGTIKGVKYKTKNGQELVARAPLTIVCDGCFSNLRQSLCDSQVDVPSCFVGLVLENCELPFANLAHIILANPSPVLFYQISSTEIRCLVDFPGKTVPSISNGEMAKYLITVVAPQIPQQLYDGFIKAIKKGNIKTMPNRIMPSQPHRTPGAFLIGDAFNMRHALTGGGMTVALSDVVVLRDLLRSLHDLRDPIALSNHLQPFYTLRKPMAFTINTMAGAISTVLCSSSDPTKQEIRQACFEYLSMGGVFTRGPISLLCGLNPTPLSLLFHFIGIGIYAVGQLLLPFPSFTRVRLGVNLILGASKIILPIIRTEGVRQLLFP